LPTSHALIKGILEALNLTYLVAGLIIQHLDLSHSCSPECPDTYVLASKCHSL
jgi:hypothetical protein